MKQHEVLAILRGQELTSGHHFPGLTNAAPLSLQFASWVNIDGWMQPGDLRRIRGRVEWLLKLPHQNSTKVQVWYLTHDLLEKVRVK
jgi:hypothetical protein